MRTPSSWQHRRDGTTTREEACSGRWVEDRRIRGTGRTVVKRLPLLTGSSPSPSAGLRKHCRAGSGNGLRVEKPRERQGKPTGHRRRMDHHMPLDDTGIFQNGSHRLGFGRICTTRCEQLPRSSLVSCTDRSGAHCTSLSARLLPQPTQSRPPSVVQCLRSKARIWRCCVSMCDKPHKRLRDRSRLV